MATNSQDQGRLKSNSLTRCPSPLAMSVPSFFGVTKIDCEKSAKVSFFDVKWPPFRGILSIWAQISQCTPGPPKIHVCKISCESLQN